jgi:hypothetical protein
MVTCKNCEYHCEVMFLGYFHRGRFIDDGWIIRCRETGEEHHERYVCNLFTPLEEEEEQ